MKKNSFASMMAVGICASGLAMFVPQNVSAVTIFEGFENSPGSYNLATSGNGSAAIVTSPDPVYAGSQALQLSLTTSSDYARVKLDITSQGITLGQITSADYWVDRTEGAASGQLPYLILSIDTPGSNGDSTLAVMYNNPAPFGATYTDMTINGSTLFHVEGDGTGLANPGSITLAQLQNSFYAPGVSCGSFAVDFVRIGYGMGNDDGIPSTSYVDNLTINASSVPDQSATWAMLAASAGLIIVLRRRIKA